MPIRLPLSTTGNCRNPPAAINAPALASLSRGPTQTGFAVIQLVTCIWCTPSCAVGLRRKSPAKESLVRSSEMLKAVGITFIVGWLNRIHDTVVQFGVAGQTIV